VWSISSAWARSFAPTAVSVLIVRQAHMPERVLRQLRELRMRRDAELRALIAKAAEGGVSSEAIADSLGVSRSTLWRHYRDQLQQHP
jgi:transposase-like protein